MKAIKPLCEPKNLTIMRYLNTRMKLSVQQKNYYLNLEKGYEGELLFNDWLGKVSNDFLILNDVRLEYNNTSFQTDTFLLSQNTLYPCEVKNYEGDFYIENDKWYAVPKKDIKNPVHQIQRSETLLRQLLRELGYHFSVEPYVIFVNPNFQLYHAPMNQPLIFPTQLNRFVNKMNMIPSTLNDRHYSFAETLKSLHIEESPYKNVPPYSYEQLQKGITCASCNSFISEVTGRQLVCIKCGFQEDVHAAVLRIVREFTLLFPDWKITTNVIFDFCKILSKKTIRNVLSRNYKLIRYGKSSYYVCK
jgi:hypothetical protein